MKYIYFPLLLFLLAGCSRNLSDLDKSGLKGKVHLVKEHTYKAHYRNGQWETGAPGRFGHMLIEYDRNGNYLVGTVLNEQGDTLGSTRCRREGGELVEEAFYTPSGNRVGRTMYERISSDEVQFELWEGNNLRYEGANFYDRSGRIEKQLGLENDMEVVNYFEYDGQLLVKNFQEDLTGRRIYTRHYDYTRFDKKGNWTFKLVYTGEEKIVPELAIIREYTYF
jgi:hypothetical protein